MKYYKDADGNIYAYELDGSSDHLIPPGHVRLTPEEENEVENPTQSDDQIKAILHVGINVHLNEKAQSFGFESIVTAVTYADEPAEINCQCYGRALREWRSLCWRVVFDAMNEWEAGGPEPSIEELIESLPEFIEPIVPTT
jgi:hypothetical protein